MLSDLTGITGRAMFFFSGKYRMEVIVQHVCLSATLMASLWPSDTTAGIRREWLFRRQHVYISAQCYYLVTGLDQTVTFISEP